MKKFILSIILLLTVVLFLSSKADAQTREECAKTRARASYNCLTGWTKCYYPCTDRTKDVSACYKTCKQSEDACNKQVDADYKACLAAIPKEDSKASAEANAQPKNIKTTLETQQLETLKQQPTASEVKKETPAKSQPRQYPADIFEKIPVTVGGWFEFASAGIELGELLTGFTKGFTIADDAIIEDEKEEKEWDQYYQSYNSLKSQGLTHEQIETTLQKPRKRDVSMSLQELDALKAKLRAGESITNVPGTTNTKLYSWETDSGALIKSTDWEKIEFRQPVVEDNVTTRTIRLKEGEMEVKVKNEAPATNKFAVDANGFFDLFVIQTHFWIDYDPDKKLAMVGVYEGQVEIKTKSGKTIKVAPDGDPSTGSGQGKPGVVIISQKLSPVKLAVVGLVVITLLGGIVLILRKRFSSNLLKKKK